MNRIVYMVLRNIVRLPAWFYHICKLGREDDPHTTQERYDYLRAVILKVNKTGRVAIQVSGLENLPKQNGFILFPNHQGLFDMLALIEACPKALSVVLKKEVVDTILVKQVVKLLRAIPMDRKDVRESLKIINRMTEDVKLGKNYVIFPEGTRSKNGNQILEFKAGTFKSAMNAGCPIVPVALVDSYKPFGTASIKKETVQIHFLKPLTSEQYAGKKTKEIASFVHDQIQNKIYENISKNSLDNIE